MADKYESLSYSLKLKRAVRTGVITLAVCLVILVPLLWLWDLSIQRRAVLREAKNVVLNMNLLALEFYGFGTDIVDDSRSSRMSEKAEEQVRSYSGVEGEFYLKSWDAADNCVDTMIYSRGRFLVVYRYNEAADSERWTVYYQSGQYESNGA